MSSYVSLHTHSEFSLLDGLSRIPDLLKKCQEYDMPALAITDHGSMYAAIKFYLAAKEAKIKPIIGVETYQAERSRKDKQSKIDQDQYHLILLAKNYTGYKNLMKISSKSFLEGYYYKPRIDWEILEKYHEGIIATSACNNGLIGSLIKRGEREKAQEAAQKYAEIFGKDNFYLEIQHHQGLDEINKIYDEIAALSRKLGIPLVATNDSHYTNPTDAEAQETLLCIQTQKTWLDKNRPLSMIDCPDFYFKSPQEMGKNFQQYPEALENTLKIADQVDVEIPMDKLIFPPFPVPDGEAADSYLEKMVWEKVGKRYPTITSEVKERINHELKIVKQVGYAPYLLVFADLANWALAQGIMRNVRGSGASSIINYILGTSTLDPIKYRIPFERFLYVGRPSPADIDFDIADANREQAVEYIRKKYGEDKVAQVITFGTMEARAAIRDVARALGYPYAVGDRIAKMTPQGSQGFPMYLDKAIELNPDLNLAYKNDPDTKKIIDLAKKLEGIARHASVHAAGVVIADKDLTEYAPLQLDPKGGKVITQYDMYSLDLNVSTHAVGLMKMDFLGLRNLTILGEAVKFVEQNQGVEIDLEKIPLDDKKVFDMITKGDTTGVFQLESGGMRKLVRELKPTTVDDLGALVALYRPGPMEIIPDFIQRKNHPELVIYLHDDLRPILEETYGLIIYQEQVMEIANKLGGYSLGESDGFRKAMGKKKPELMKKEGEKFVAGMAKKGYSKKLADQLFSMIEKFAAYGFNKAHSASYGLISYQTAYMKYHYPVEYMTAMLTAESRANTGDTKDEKTQMCIEECRRMKIAVLPPDINKSHVEFTIEENSIRFGLSAIKNVGAAAIESILAARNANGSFRSLADMARRVDLQKVNRKTLESLIKAGALDSFGTRAALLSSLDKVISDSHKVAKQLSAGQTGLFDAGEAETKSDFKLPDIEELPKEQLLTYEREFLGIYLTENPARKLLEKASDSSTHDIADLTPEIHNGKVVTVGGVVVAVRRIFTKKNNDEMAFVTIEGVTGSKIECVVFPKIYSENGNLGYFQENSVILLSGRVDSRDDRLSIIVDRVKKIN